MADDHAVLPRSGLVYVFGRLLGLIPGHTEPAPDLRPAGGFVRYHTHGSEARGGHPHRRHEGYAWPPAACKNN